MLGFNSKRRLPLTLAIIAGLIIISLAIGRADGAKPHPDSTYTGTIDVTQASGKVIQMLAISFSVNGTASRVGAFSFAAAPSACPSARLGPVVVSGHSLPILHPSRFRGDFPILSGSASAHDSASAGTHGVTSARRVGTLEIGVSFGSLDRALGDVASIYPGALARCDASDAFTSRTGF